MTFIITLLALVMVNPFTPANNELSSRDKVEIVIESNDQMKFNMSEIRVKEGDTIVLTLKHVGKLPKAAMGHNWVL